MVTNEERREVARRLREVQANVIPGTKTEAHPIAGRIIGVACGYDLPDFQGLLGRLADLIEPTPKCSEPTPKVDRDALLEVADDAIKEAERKELSCYDRSAATVGTRYVREISDRIRTALGVPDEYQGAASQPGRQ